MREKLCSIITVSYNSEKTIKRAIESILNQTYEEIEYIIIDGASKDGTVDIIKEYEPLFKGRLKWVSEPDEGIYYAMNKGIKMASGCLIGILNSDDTYELDAVEKMMGHVNGEKAQVLYGMARVYSGDEMTSVSMISHKSLPKKMICHSGCFVTKKAYDEQGDFNTEYVSVADYELMLRYYYSGKVEFIPVYELISNFWAGGMSSTDTAYLDLLKLKSDRGMIRKSKYQYHVILSKLIKLKRKIIK